MAFDAYLKIDNISGEALDANHKDWIEILDFRYMLEQPISSTASSSGGATAGGAKCVDLYINKYIDKASPKIFEACASGQHFKNMVIDINRAGGSQQRYLQIKLEEVIISSVTGNGTHFGDIPTESIMLNYGRISFNYVQQKRSDGQGGGAVSGGWDRIGKRKFA